MKQFQMPTKIFFGENALDRLAQLPQRRALLIADPFVVSSGMIHRLTERLEQAGIRWSVYQDIVPDPPIASISDGVQALIKDSPDLLIAVGGGSALDSAKLIREVAFKMDSECLSYFVAIPTTSGTGSEVTSFSVVTDEESRRKIPIVSTHMLPDEAILDVTLVSSVPASIVADTGMDVFTHALESYVSTGNHEFSAAMAEKTLELVRDFLLRSYQSAQDLRAREKMHIASCMAGIAFNQSALGLNHGIAHQLGAKFHIPHGRANAMVLPLVIRFNAGDDLERPGDKPARHVEKYAAVAHMLGLPSYHYTAAIASLCTWIESMMRQMQMPRRMSETGACSREEYFAAIPAMARGALEDHCTATNPRKASVKDVENLLERLW